jgi:hypothetical protein
MFIRYTHFGVGHPAMLRRIARDCESVVRGGVVGGVTSTDETDLDMGHDENGHRDTEDDEDDSNSDSDSEEVSDEGFSDEDLGLDHVEDIDGDEGEDEFDDLLSF